MVRRAVTNETERRGKLMSNNFIVTTSAKKADELSKAGFQMISNSDGRWLFINDSKLTFTFDENVTFTNRLYF